MKKMKGIVAAAALVGILVLAGSALAWGGPGGGKGMMGRPDSQNWNQGNRPWNQDGRQWNQDGRQWNQDGRKWNRGSPMGRGYYHHQGGRRGMGTSHRRGGPFMMGSRGFCGPMAMGNWVEVPQEIRDKQVEAYKLSAEMRNEMGKIPVDRAKIEELYKKSLDLRNELSGWRMKQRLDLIEKLQK